jgi:FlaA1/EpsC-like NDP-sugar epimerase
VVTRRAAVILHDLIMAALAWMLAVWARHDFSLMLNQSGLLQLAPWIVAAQGVILWWTGTYRGLWRFASVADLWNIMRSALLGVLAIALGLFLFNRLEGVPRGVLLLYPVFLVMLLGAPRQMYRLWKDHRVTLFDRAERKRVLLLGAGRGGEALVRDMLHSAEYLPVGFLDDNPELKGAKIHGVPLLGTLEELPHVVRRKDVDVIVIAMPSATNAQMQRAVSLCEQTAVPFRALPRLRDLVSGQSALQALKEVALEDLLNRETVSLDWQAIRNGLTGKTVLITGGGGSIGSELCRQVARLGVSALLIYERSEFNLYGIEMELREKFPNLTLQACLGDVCDASAVRHLLQRHRPEVIFHAAAYKHVPMLEHQVREAVRNNVFGTKTLIEEAERCGCATFVLISTDKAVNPTNVMGASKRIAEIFAQALGRRSTMRLITVRFGNVLGSAGSVVPLFQKQIAAGGPVTVTHPEITRFFMTTPEACQLIMQASVIGKGGEIYVLDMGKPVSIAYLAQQMIRLSGKIPGKDVKIVYTGLRPGEKLYEELFHEQEKLTPTSHPKILFAQCRDYDWQSLYEHLEELGAACDDYDEPRLRMLVKRMVPELDEAPDGRPSNIVPLART